MLTNEHNKTVVMVSQHRHPNKNLLNQQPFGSDLKVWLAVNTKKHQRSANWGKISARWSTDDLIESRTGPKHRRRVSTSFSVYLENAFR